MRTVQIAQVGEASSGTDVAPSLRQAVPTILHWLSSSSR
jgi:hypothetical protein